MIPRATWAESNASPVPNRVQDSTTQNERLKNCVAPRIEREPCRDKFELTTVQTTLQVFVRHVNLDFATCHVKRGL